MLLSYQNTGQNCDIEIAKRSSENVLRVQVFGNNNKNKNLIHEGIQRGLQSCNDTLILRVVLYGCEAWSLECKLSVWEEGTEENIWTE
jgi:hypothetical protein